MAALSNQAVLLVNQYDEWHQFQIDAPGAFANQQINMIIEQINERIEVEPVLGQWLVNNRGFFFVNGGPFVNIADNFLNLPIDEESFEESSSESTSSQ